MTSSSCSRLKVQDKTKSTTQKLGESVRYLKMNHQKEGAARKIFYLCERRDRHTNFILNDEGRNVGPIKAKDQGVIPPLIGLIFSNVSKN